MHHTGLSASAELLVYFSRLINTTNTRLTVSQLFWQRLAFCHVLRCIW